MFNTESQNSHTYSDLHSLETKKNKMFRIGKSDESVYTGNIQRQNSHIYSDLHPQQSTRADASILYLECNVENINQSSIDNSYLNNPAKALRCSKRCVFVFIIALLLWTTLVVGLAYVLFSALERSEEQPRTYAKSNSSDVSYNGNEFDIKYNSGRAASIFSFTHYPDVRAQCQEGWSKQKSECVKIFDEHKTWFQAIEFCRSIGSDLLSVHNTTEAEMINSKLSKEHHYWIGLNDIHRDGTYVWIDGTGVDFLNWKRGEPNDFNGLENCVEIESGGEWNDANCYISQKFICKKNLTSKCGNGDWLFYNESCYSFGTSDEKPALSWNDSRNYCNERGADLAIIESNEERQFLLSQRGKLRKLIWIGLSYQPQTPGYIWIDGTYSSDMPWSGGRHQVMNGGCVGILWYGNYYRHECNREFNFVCEKKFTS